MKKLLTALALFCSMSGMIAMNVSEVEITLMNQYDKNLICTVVDQDDEAKTGVIPAGGGALISNFSSIKYLQLTLYYFNGSHYTCQALDPARILKMLRDIIQDQKDKNPNKDLTISIRPGEKHGSIWMEAELTPKK